MVAMVISPFSIYHSPFSINHIVKTQHNISDKYSNIFKAPMDSASSYSELLSKYSDQERMARQIEKNRLALLQQVEKEKEEEH
jgi:hypothetical protein